MANGSDIHPDLLVEIVKLLTELDDFFAFSLVCRSWRLAAVQQSFRFNNYTKIPWLMYAPPAKATCRNHRRVFLDLSTGKTRPIMLPDHIDGKSRCFSSKGWLITIAQDTTMRLFHPFACAEIKLPHVKTIKNWKNYEIDTMYAHFVKRCVLSSCPLSASDYTLMIIYGERRQLAYTKGGEKSWNTVRTLYDGFFDVIYYKHNFYAINSLGEIMILRGDNPSVAEKVAVVLPTMPYKLIERNGDNLYMVESVESLLVVRRKGVCNRGTYRASKFQVFQVDLSNKTWTEVKSLGDRALFLGRNSSISVLCSSGGFNNCIYFTDDCSQNQVILLKEGEDIGIYNMGDGRIKPYFEGHWYNRLNPSMWIELTF